jgi:biopolymer transport protein ExbD
MAEINPIHIKRKKTLAPALKKKFPRVDLTPMVDLGFLLITFFMFATTIAEPRALKLTSPKECPGCAIKVAHEKGLIILLGKDDLIYSYEAMNPEKSFRIHRFSDINGFRKMLADKKIRTRAAIPNDPELIISLKSTEDATYGNFVNMLDELQINQAGIAVIDKPDDTEKQMIRLSRL